MAKSEKKAAINPRDFELQLTNWLIGAPIVVFKDKNKTFSTSSRKPSNAGSSTTVAEDSGSSSAGQKENQAAEDSAEDVAEPRAEMKVRRRRHHLRHSKQIRCLKDLEHGKKKKTSSEAVSDDEEPCKKKTDSKAGNPAVVATPAAAGSCKTADNGTQTDEEPPSKSKSESVQTAEDPCIKDKSEGVQTGTGAGQDGSEWMAEQDAKLLELKGGGKTWAEISKEISHCKSSCHKRFKELGTGGGKPAASKPAVSKLAPAATAVDASIEDELLLVGLADIADPVATAAAPAENSAKETSKLKKGGKDDKKNKKQQETGDDNDKDKSKDKDNADKEMEQKILVDGNQGSTSDDSDSESEEDVAYSSRQYLYSHIYPALYGGGCGGGGGGRRGSSRRLGYGVDAWSRDDRRLIAALDARRRAERWLELQAAFFNATGRMVSVEVLRRAVLEQRSSGEEDDEEADEDEDEEDDE